MAKALILLAEDRSEIREMTRTYLEIEGYAVIEAANGDEAVVKTIEHKPDLILMDIGMPVLDGVAATRAIRQNDEVAEVPIVVVTGFGALFAEAAHAAGCNVLVQKPFRLET